MTPKDPVSNLKSDFKNLNLGPLEFTRDFCKQYVDLIREGIVGAVALQDALNRTLADKLKEAPEVFGVYDTAGGAWTSSYDNELDRYRARLVYIEKLEGK